MDWTKYQMTMDQEADHLARRTGLTRYACKYWMQEHGITCTMQLQLRYDHGISNAECYRRAANEIEAFILQS